METGGGLQSSAHQQFAWGFEKEEKEVEEEQS